MSNFPETDIQPEIQRLESLGPVRVNTEKAALFLGVSVRTLEEWRKKDIGPAFMKIGRKLIRYEMAELERFLRATND